MASARLAASKRTCCPRHDTTPIMTEADARPGPLGGAETTFSQQPARSVSARARRTTLSSTSYYQMIGFFFVALLAPSWAGACV